MAEDRAEGHMAALHGRSVSGDLVGPNEETLHSFSSDAQVDLGAIAKAYDGQHPSQNFLEGAYVDIEFDEYEQIGNDSENSEVAFSPNFASMVAIDRVLAIPRGFRFLAGQALAHFHNKDLVPFQIQWRRLIEGLGGRQTAIELVAPHLDRWGNGYEDVAAGLDALNKAVELARDADQDLVVVCCPVP